MLVGEANSFIAPVQEPKDLTMTKKVPHTVYLAKKKCNKIAYNVWCYTKEAIISTKVDAEYKCLFNHKCFYGELNRLFCIARVSGSLLTKLKFKIWEHK